MPNREIVSLAPQDIRRIARTIFRLRQMRGHTFFQEKPDGLDIAFIQEKMQDAEKLGSAAATAIIGLVQEEPAEPHRTRWDKTLERFGRKYRGFPQYHRGHQTTGESANTIGSDYLGALQRQWKEKTRYLLRINLGSALQPDDLLDPNLGVIAPLSTDYLLLAVIQQYLATNVSSSAFHLKPAFVETGLGCKAEIPEVVLPQTNDGKRIFENCTRVAILLDGVGFYTQPALIRALRQIYPDKIVYHEYALLRQKT